MTGGDSELARDLWERRLQCGRGQDPNLVGADGGCAAEADNDECSQAAGARTNRDGHGSASPSMSCLSHAIENARTSVGMKARLRGWAMAGVACRTSWRCAASRCSSAM